MLPFESRMEDSCPDEQVYNLNMHQLEILGLVNVQPTYSTIFFGNSLGSWEWGNDARTLKRTCQKRYIKSFLLNNSNKYIR